MFLATCQIPELRGLSVTKGQTMLKWFFQASISSKKWTNELYFTTMKAQVDLFLFVFWKKLKTPKRHFEKKLTFINYQFYVNMFWMLQSTFFTLYSTVADRLVYLPIKKLAALLLPIKVWQRCHSRWRQWRDGTRNSASLVPRGPGPFFTPRFLKE